MPSWLTSAWTASVRALGGLLDSLFRWAGIIGAFFIGQRRQQNAEIVHDNKIKDRQLRSAARAPRKRDELIERMKRYGL